MSGSFSIQAYHEMKRMKILTLPLPCRFLSASSSEGVLGNVLLPEVTVPWSRGLGRSEWDLNPDAA